MGRYRDLILPHLVDRVCAMSAIAPWRARVVEGVHGRVVEIGFGSGLNVGHYPAAVQLVLAVEPAAGARRLAARRLATGTAHVDVVGADAEHLPIIAGTFDAALSTFTLCTVRDPVAVLREVRRVLRPGGTLHFLEHGIAREPRVAAWQRRLDPLQRRFAGGCHLTRDVIALVTSAGLHLERCEQAYADGPRPWSFFTVGVASSP